MTRLASEPSFSSLFRGINFTTLPVRITVFPANWSLIEYKSKTEIHPFAKVIPFANVLDETTFAGGEVGSVASVAVGSISHSTNKTESKVFF